MEPLSGISGIITVIGAANTTVHCINRIRSLVKAPKAINGLINEVEALRRLLTDIQQFYEPIETHRLLLLQNSSKGSSNVNLEIESPLSAYLAQAKMKLAKLDELINRKFKEGPGKHLKGPASVRFAWLSSEATVKDLRNDINSINTGITACLAVTAVTAITAQSRLRYCLEEAIPGTRETIFPNVPTNKIRNRPDSPHNSQLEKTYSSGDEDQKRDLGGDLGTSFPFQMSSNLSRNENYCRNCCACRCHRRNRIQMSSFDNLMGSLCLTYSHDFPHLPCNDELCKRRMQIALNLTYHFPCWLLSRVIETYWGSDSIGCPMVALRMPRIQPDTAPIFHLAAAGDIEGMQRMFRLGLASPDDVSYAFSYSVLHFAVDMEDVGAIKFLIYEGANPMLANRLNLTAVDLTWNRILCKRTTGKKGAELALLFGTANREDQIQSRRLTLLQQAILGLVDTDLETTMNSSSQADINTADADGNTALSWAARCCNAAAVRALLKRGAKFHQTSRFGSTALHYAASAHSPDCIRPLLEAGADPNIRNSCLLETPVHVAALRHDDPERFLTPLIEYGANIDTQDHEGSSALAFAVQANHARSLRFLLDHGADADVPDDSGIPPVGVAVMYKRSDLLQILLEYNVSVKFTTDAGQTLLHLVALYGDSNVILVLKAAKCQLPHEILDGSGVNALTYAKGRGEGEFLAAFTELIPTKRI